MATDLVFTQEIVEAVVDCLKGGLPANWFDDGADAGEVPLKLLTGGDLADYTALRALERDLPAIIVRGFGPERTGSGGAGGRVQVLERVRVVHLRGNGQCHADDGDVERNMTRARARYAKLIHKAIFQDAKGRLAVIGTGGTRTDVTLTSADTAGARLQQVVFEAWDLGHDVANPHSMEDVALVRRLPMQAWAIGCEFGVYVDAGGEA